MTTKEVKTRRKRKGQPYERSLKTNKKNQSRKWTQIQRRNFKVVRTKSHRMGKDWKLLKRHWTEESSVETFDTKRIHLDVTDRCLEIREWEAAKHSCPKFREHKNGRRLIVEMIL
jgi:hypothetical protein